jgi:hypothetical protein
MNSRGTLAFIQYGLSLKVTSSRDIFRAKTKDHSFEGLLLLRLLGSSVDMFSISS